jgi:hypothetical protein
MMHITLTPEQEAALRSAREDVAICDSNGKVVGHIGPEEREAHDVAEALRRLATTGARVSADDVAAHLRALEAEWKRTGGLDAASARAFVAKLRAEARQ